VIFCGFWWCVVVSQLVRLDQRPYAWYVVTLGAGKSKIRTAMAMTDGQKMADKKSPRRFGGFFVFVCEAFMPISHNRRSTVVLRPLFLSLIRGHLVQNRGIDY